ncbi:hypothetical protein AB0C12_05720 [Actinoplanes sp. NPDC048967]|uniref:hypothetical protein n=1 Tax=Actinoplanes sp. NPDC048967 TaxID=3155269 RepID=UPI0033CE8BDD
MDHDQARSKPLAGLWACVVGGLLLAALLLYLDPVSTQQDCPNYGGNGNASAYPSPVWDLLFPLLTLLWVACVIAEQCLAETWQGRSRLEGAVRACVAVFVSMSTAFVTVVSFAVVCR